MPTVTRYFVRTGLVCLLLALAAGILLATGVAPTLPGTAVVLPFPTYLHLLTVGWLTNLIFGVALWLFPRHTAEQPRGSDALGWAAYAALNGGLLLRLLGEPLLLSDGRGASLLLASAGLQLLGAWAFVANIWPRVKAR